MSGRGTRVERPGPKVKPAIAAAVAGSASVWSSAFRRLGAFTALCRVNAELRTKRPLASGAVRGCAPSQERRTVPGSAGLPGHSAATTGVSPASRELKIGTRRRDAGAPGNHAAEPWQPVLAAPKHGAGWLSRRFSGNDRRRQRQRRDRFRAEIIFFKQAGSDIPSPMEIRAATANHSAPRWLPRFWPWLVVLLLLVFVGFIRVRLLDVPLERDEGEYAYAGQLLLQGIPPYELAYNMKLPGTYFIYALGMALFGQSIAGIHLMLLLANSLTIIFVFLLGRQLFGVAAGLAAGASYGILSASAVVYGTAAHATHFVVLFAVPATLVFVERRRIKKTSDIFPQRTALRAGVFNEAAGNLLWPVRRVFFVLAGGAGAVHFHARFCRINPGVWTGPGFAGRHFLSLCRWGGGFWQVLVLDICLCRFIRRRIFPG